MISRLTTKGSLLGSGEGVCGCIVRTAGKVESVVKWPDKGGNGAVGGWRVNWEFRSRRARLSQMAEVKLLSGPDWTSFECGFVFCMSVGS